MISQRQSLREGLTGLRYYGRPEKTSWYAGGRLGLISSKAILVYQDAKIHDDASGIPLVFAGGYRWLLLSSLAVRIGAHGGPTATIKRDISTDSRSAAQEGRGKVEDRNWLQMETNLDIGLGYAF